MDIILSVILFFLLLILLAAFFNKHLPVWFCTKMGWHLAPRDKGWDGCSMTGKCPRCNKAVLMDSQGNWF